LYRHCNEYPTGTVDRKIVIYLEKEEEKYKWNYERQPSETLPLNMKEINKQ